ncbi:MAG: lactoylglutathione lyase [Lautropia sp.]
MNLAAPPVPGFRFMHVMLRVLELERALEFYVGDLGMREIRRRESPEGRYTNVFVGYGPEETDTVVELTWNWDQTQPYEAGSSYGHIALGTPDVYQSCARLSARGVRVTRQPGPVQFGSTVIAFIEDPDGHKIELIQT